MNFERVIIELSYGNSHEKLLSLDCLTRDQMQFANRTNLLQLREAANSVTARKDKLAIPTMFNIEIKFSANAILKWFNVKVKSKNLELDLMVQSKYQI